MPTVLLMPRGRLAATICALAFFAVALLAPPPGRAAVAEEVPSAGEVQGELRGSLGVRFLGLKLRLTARPLSAALEDEEGARASRLDRPAAFAARRSPIAHARVGHPEIQPAEEQFSLILERKRPGSRPDVLEGTHVLSLVVYPSRGIAVASTASNNYDIENKVSAAYVERIPKGPFDGHLDLDFPGLGTFVGDFTARETSVEHGPKGCVGPSGSFQVGDLEGSVEFHGGGFADWSASHALAFLERSPKLRCRVGAALQRRPRPKSLFGYFAGSYGSFSHWRYSLRARLRRPHRFTELLVLRYESDPPKVNFDADTYEWLPGDIATGRFVFRSVRGAARLEVSHGGVHPAHATVRPPSPYSGVGTYSRTTHRLTGSLAIRFPGLNLRFAGRDTIAGLFDEAGRAEEATGESTSSRARSRPPRSTRPSPEPVLPPGFGP